MDNNQNANGNLNEEVAAPVAPETVAEPAPEAVAETAPEAVAEPAPEAVAEPAPEAAAEPAPETVAEPAPETVAEPAPQPVFTQQAPPPQFQQYQQAPYQPQQQYQQAPYQPQQQYQQAPAQAPVATGRPALQHATGRSLVKMIFLSMLTFGIYPMVIYSRIVDELNIAACRYDGKKTMPFFVMLLLTPVTLGILPLVWWSKYCSRIGDELQRRNINYSFGAGMYWLWNILGSFIFVGPFIFIHKLMKSMNLINENYNSVG